MYHSFSHEDFHYVGGGGEGEKSCTRNALSLSPNIHYTAIEQSELLSFAL